MTGAWWPSTIAESLEAHMKVAIRRLGNSQGVIIPKPVLAQVGLVAEAEMRVEKGVIVLQKPASSPRTGWAEASKTTTPWSGRNSGTKPTRTSDGEARRGLAGEPRPHGR